MDSIRIMILDVCLSWMCLLSNLRTAYFVELPTISRVSRSRGAIGDRPRGAEAPVSPVRDVHDRAARRRRPPRRPACRRSRPRPRRRAFGAGGGRACPAAARTEPDATAPSADGSEPRTELQPAARPAGGDVRRPAASAVALAGPRPARRESDATGISKHDDRNPRRDNHITKRRIFRDETHTTRHRHTHTHTAIHAHTPRIMTAAAASHTTPHSHTAPRHQTSHKYLEPAPESGIGRGWSSQLCTLPMHFRSHAHAF
jgi:hypothetical protein